MVYKFSAKFLIEKFLKKIGACKKFSVTKKYLTERGIGRGRVAKKKFAPCKNLSRLKNGYVLSERMFSVNEVEPEGVRHDYYRSITFR